MPAVFFIYNMNSLEDDQPMCESRWEVYMDCWVNMYCGSIYEIN
jgi:hypothetical protein